MLGYLSATEWGAADLLIRDVAMRLRDDGVTLAGAVQVNLETGPETKCHMDLHILDGRDTVRISQDLGALSSGCRLDPDGLERAVGLVTRAVDNGAALLIVNKFGKQEIDGHGFRPLIGRVLSDGIPVLTSVNPQHEAAFLEYAADLAERLPPEVETLTAWCHARIGEASRTG